MEVNFPVRKKSENFEHTGKVEDLTTNTGKVMDYYPILQKMMKFYPKYWKSDGILVSQENLLFRKKVNHLPVLPSKFKAAIFMFRIFYERIASLFKIILCRNVISMDQKVIN